MNSKYTLEQREFCVAKINEGLTYKQTSESCYEKFGLRPNKSTLNSWYKKAAIGDLIDKSIPKNEDEIKEKQELKNYCSAHRRNGRTYKEIQGFLNLKGYSVSLDTVRRWCYEGGAYNNYGKSKNSEVRIYNYAKRKEAQVEDKFENVHVGFRFVIGSNNYEVLSKTKYFAVCLVNGKYRESVSKSSIAKAI